MTQPLKILLLEDDEDDVIIIREFLYSAQIHHQLDVVKNKKAFVAALDTTQPDVILSDNNLAGFSSIEALTMIRERQLELPFILVTGTLSDEFAINIIKLGADDYILKDRLTRLPTAIHKAITRKQLEKEKHEAAERLAQNEANYRTLFLKSPLPMWIYDPQTLRFLEVNEVAMAHYGYTKEEFRQMTLEDIRPPEDIASFQADVKKISNGPDVRRGIWRHLKKNGEIIYVEIAAQSIEYNGKQARIIVINDITRRKQNEEAMQSLQAELLTAQKKTTRAMIKAQEQERNHIGRELHDNVNQILTTAKLLLEVFIEDNTPVGDPLMRPYELVQNAIREIRQLTSGYVDGTIAASLSDMILKLFDTISLSAGIQTKLAYHADNEKISNELKLNIYRIIQEQLNNIIKHAAAEHINVIIETEADSLIIQTIDDGRGFDVNMTRKGIGISNMINRVEAFNGEITIDSAPGRGTRTWIKVPMQMEGVG